jgi:hypothetical protein
VATGVEVETQPPPLVAYELDEPEFLVDGVAWTVGPRMYSQPTGPTQRGRHDRASRLRRVLLGLFEPYAFSIVDDNGREVGRLYGNPIGAGGAGAFAASAGPTLTGPAAYLSNADARRLQEAHDGSLVRLVSGGTLHPGAIQRNVLGLLRGEDVRTVVVSAHYDVRILPPGVGAGHSPSSATASPASPSRTCPSPSTTFALTTSRYATSDGSTTDSTSHASSSTT